MSNHIIIKNIFLKSHVSIIFSFFPYKLNLFSFNLNKIIMSDTSILHKIFSFYRFFKTDICVNLCENFWARILAAHYFHFVYINFAQANLFIYDMRKDLKDFFEHHDFSFGKVEMNYIIDRTLAFCCDLLVAFDDFFYRIWKSTMAYKIVEISCQRRS